MNHEVPRSLLELETPEHVPLPFEIAPGGARVLALLLDLIVIFLVIAGLVVITLLLVSAFGGGDGSGYVVALFLVGAFVIRNFYFTFAELRWHGQTLGKRKLGLRVIARDGGPLTSEMIFARNLTRDLEIFLPAIVLFAPDLLFGATPGWARLVAAIWIFAIALLPVFNRQSARVGDLVAGTVVVVSPRAQLMGDLVREAAQASAEFVFTREQLDIYGIHELQVLEDVLRGDVSGRETLVIEIADKVKRKIGWDPQRWYVHPEPFLRAFYAAQRTRLEHKMLLGSRQERKIR
jgi:uncharacterized RDD family membrane protein YckC